MQVVQDLVEGQPGEIDRLAASSNQGAGRHQALRNAAVCTNASRRCRHLQAQREADNRVALRQPDVSCDLQVDEVIKLRQVPKDLHPAELLHCS